MQLWRWVTPRLSRSRWMDLPNLTLTKYASGGSAWKHPSLSTCTFPNHTFRTKVYYVSSEHIFSIDAPIGGNITTSQSVRLSAISVCQTFFQVQPRHKNTTSLQLFFFFRAPNVEKALLAVTTFQTLCQSFIRFLWGVKSHQSLFCVKRGLKIRLEDIFRDICLSN